MPTSPKTISVKKREIIEWLINMFKNNSPKYPNNVRKARGNIAIFLPSDLESK